MSVHRCFMKWSGLRAVASVDIGLVGQKDFSHGLKTVFGGQMERGLTGTVAGVHVRAFRQEQLDHRLVAAGGCDKEGGPTV